MIESIFKLRSVGWSGMKVVVSPDLGPRPVLQIDPNFKCCSDEFRAKHNAWLLERFGMKDDAYIVQGNTVIVSPQTAAKLGMSRVGGGKPAAFLNNKENNMLELNKLKQEKEAFEKRLHAVIQGEINKFRVDGGVMPAEIYVGIRRVDRAGQHAPDYVLTGVEVNFGL